jgi:hypothetical protein
MKDKGQQNSMSREKLPLDMCIENWDYFVHICLDMEIFAEPPQQKWKLRQQEYFQ